MSLTLAKSSMPFLSRVCHAAEARIAPGPAASKLRQRGGQREGQPTPAEPPPAEPPPAGPC